MNTPDSVRAKADVHRHPMSMALNVACLKTKEAKQHQASMLCLSLARMTRGKT